MDRNSIRIECQLTVKKANYWVVRRLRLIADYQFFAGAGSCLFPLGVDASVSPRTGKLKEIRERGSHLGTLSPKTGTFSLSLEGARRIQSSIGCPRVIVGTEFVSPISKGGNVFARHVTEADENIRSGNEVIVLSENSALIAVGRSRLSGEEAKRFKRGIAIKVRRGASAHDVSKNGS
jgi:predicted RNA-binding protein (TIGR00451 family)